MAEISNFYGNIAAWVKNFWAERPEDILLLGFIVGFLAVSAAWRNKRLNEPSGLLLSLRNLSSAVIIFICIGMAGYVAVTISPEGAGYYIAALLSGIIAGRVFLLLLSLLFFLGDIAGTVLNFVSGPAGVFTVWLFHKDELLPAAENLFSKILKIFSW
jgi:hypothetical protein